MPAAMSQPSISLVKDPHSLSPIPALLHRGLMAVSVLAFLSFFLSVGLLVRLSYTIIQGRKNKIHHNQFIILIVCLILADIQQSLAFLLNSQWLAQDSITVSSSTCFAQGWFVSTGDLASGVFTLAIAFHTFVDVTFDFSLSKRAFRLTILLLWTFVYAMAIIGIAMHSSDFYVRAGAWCWINGKYDSERLWLHYLWILIAEFGTIILYSTMVIILRRRIKSSYYANTPGRERLAKAAANAIVMYPLVYVICTLPLASARVASSVGADVDFLTLCVAGAMITSNGWLDVLLYSLTRRALIFSPDPPEHMRALDTFAWHEDGMYGNTTTIEAVPRPSRRSRNHSRMQRIFTTQNSSREELVEDDVPLGMVVHTKTEVTVSSSHRPEEMLMGNLRRPSGGEYQNANSARLGSMSKLSLGKDNDEFC